MPHLRRHMNRMPQRLIHEFVPQVRVFDVCGAETIELLNACGAEMVEPWCGVIVELSLSDPQETKSAGNLTQNPAVARKRLFKLISAAKPPKQRQILMVQMAKSSEADEAAKRYMSAGTCGSFSATHQCNMKAENRTSGSIDASISGGDL